MSSSKLTLLGFYRWMQTHSDDLFAELSLPSGIDRQTVIDNILLNGGEFEVYYSDPEFLQAAIGVWSTKWERTFSKWYDALNISYSPLENYDRYEDSTDTNSNTGTASSSDSSGASVSDRVSAFNSDEMRNNTESSSSNYASNNANTTNEGTNVHSARLHGNIGVTTSQQMLQSELDIAEWNLYEHITDLFLKEFVIPIY